MKKIALIENESQAREYLKNIKKFEDYEPISFSFQVEIILDEAKLDYKKDEDYEEGKIYSNIYLPSLRTTDKICNILDVKYKNIGLGDISYYSIYLRVTKLKKYLRLLKKIINKENPDEILVFYEANKKFSEEDCISRIIRCIYTKNVIKKSYTTEERKSTLKSKIIKISDIVQQNISSLIVNSTLREKNVILSTGGESYYPKVIEKFIGKGDSQVINLGTSLGKFVFINRKYLPFYKITEKKEDNENLLRKEIQNLIKKIEDEEIDYGKYLEIELLEDLRLFMIESVIKKFVSFSRKINSVAKIMKHSKVKLVLLEEEDSETAKIIVKVANMLNKPSIVFAHGVPFKKLMFGPPLSTYSLVLGKMGEKMFIESLINYPKSRNIVKMIGGPKYDSYLLSKQNKKNDNNKIILYAMEIAPEKERIADTHLTVKRQKELLKIVFRTMKKFPEYKLILKIRPKWDLKQLPYLIAKQENFYNFELIERTDNLNLMNSSEVVIVNNTTMGMEALLLGKPVISLSFKDLDKENNFKTISSVKVIYNEKELVKSIKKSIREKRLPHFREKMRNSVKDHIIPDDKSSERAIQFIESILRKKIVTLK